MKGLLSISALFVGFLLIGMVSADPRIEVNDNFCHVPYDEQNDDNESFLAGCNGRVTVTNGVADGIGVVKESWVPVASVPVEINEKKRSGEVRLSGPTTPFTCVLVDSNGTQYETAVWSVRTFVRRHRKSSIGRATYEIFCWDAVQVN